MKAIVKTDICSIMTEPTFSCERADEALCGYILDIEKENDEWYKATTHYNYTGFVHKDNLIISDEKASEWANFEKKVVTMFTCDIQESPSVRSWCLITLTRGGLVSTIGEPNEDGYFKILLPDGRTGYTKATFLGEYFNKKCNLDENTLRKSLIDTAKTYLGVHYRWGGKTPLGIDCSGLTSISYMFHGIFTFRDARLVDGFPVKEISLENIKPADLLYFKGHIAMYMSDGLYIHSTGKNGSDGVVINSLNKSDDNYREDLATGILAVGSVF